MQLTMYDDARLTAIFQTTWVNWYKTVSTLDIIGTRDDGSDDNNFTGAIAGAELQSNTSSLTNQQPTCLQAGRPSCRSTNSVKALKGDNWQYNGCQNFSWLKACSDEQRNVSSKCEENNSKRFLKKL